MKINFKNIPDNVNQGFELPAPGIYNLVVTKAEFTKSRAGSTTLYTEMTIKGSSSKVLTWTPLYSSAANADGSLTNSMITFGIARLKRILSVLDKVPEVELNLSNPAHQNMIVSLINGGEFSAELYHREYTYQGETKTVLDFKNWDELTPVTNTQPAAPRPVTSTEPEPEPEINNQVAELIEDSDVII